MKRFSIFVLAVTGLVVLPGCQSLLHELQPHRLWRWNYHDSPGRADSAFYSLSDPLELPPAAPVSTTASE